MIKNIVFDIGNVLISFKPREYLNSFPFEEDIREAIFNSVFKSKFWPELDRGTVTEEEAIKLFCEEAPELEQHIKKVMATWMDILLPIPETIEILKRLKDKGFKLFALSNYHKAAFERTFSENEFFRLLDGKVISYEVQCIKPEREIYEKLLATYDLRADETLFIDDMAENIEGAKTIGIRTHLFKDAIGFEEYLEEIKLL